MKGRYPFIAVLGSVVLFCVGAGTGKPKVVGGACAYDEFAGRCTVASSDAQSGKSYFTYKGVVKGSSMEFGGNIASKLIVAGTSAPCRLMKISKGTCTPCMISGDTISGECSREAYDAIYPKTE